MHKALFFRSVMAAVLLAPSSLVWSHQYWWTPPQVEYLKLLQCTPCVEYGPHVCNPTMPTYDVEQLYRTDHHLPPGCCVCPTAILY